MPAEPVETTADSKAIARRERLERFEDATDLPALILALLMIPLLVVPVFVELSDTAERIVDVLDLAIWVAFALHLFIRLYLTASGRRLRFLRRNWPDVVIVFVPFLRPLRIARSVRAFRLLGFVRFAGVLAVVGTEGKRLLTRHGLHYVLIVTAIVIVGGAALVSFLEEDSTSTIDSFGSGLWWAVSTVTTVGGDSFPVTSWGRAVAAAMMFAGVALVGFLAGQFAAYLGERPASSANDALVSMLTLMFDDPLDPRRDGRLSEEISDFVLGREKPNDTAIGALTSELTVFVLEHRDLDLTPKLSRQLAEFVVRPNVEVDDQFTAQLVALAVRTPLGTGNTRLAVRIAAFLLGQPVAAAEVQHVDTLATWIDDLPDDVPAVVVPVALTSFVVDTAEKTSSATSPPTSDPQPRPLGELLVALSRFLIRRRPETEAANTSARFLDFVDRHDDPDMVARYRRRIERAGESRSNEALAEQLATYVVARQQSDDVAELFARFLVRQPTPAST